MSFACGRVPGITLNTAVVPSEFTWAGVTDATSEVAVTFCCIVLSSDWLSDEDCFGSLTTTASGPLTPTPNPWDSRSYAWRLLSEGGFVPLSGWPSVIEKSGIASTASRTTLATAHGQGRSLTFRPHRANALCSCCSCVAAAVCAACSRTVRPARLARSRSVIARTFPLATPMNAGTKVSAASMVTATTTAAARPREPTKATQAT